jgi:hypothetical protein
MRSDFKVYVARAQFLKDRQKVSSSAIIASSLSVS